MREREENSAQLQAIAHRKWIETKYYRVIVFHRLVTKTTPRRHKNWFAPCVTSGEAPIVVCEAPEVYGL